MDFTDAAALIYSAGTLAFEKLPVESALLTLFPFVCAMAVYIAWTGRYMSPNFSCALWSLCLLAGVLGFASLILSTFGFGIVVHDPLPLVLASTTCITLAIVTHKYTA